MFSRDQKWTNAAKMGQEEWYEMYDCMSDHQPGGLTVSETRWLFPRDLIPGLTGLSCKAAVGGQQTVGPVHHGVGHCSLRVQRQGTQGHCEASRARCQLHARQRPILRRRHAGRRRSLRCASRLASVRDKEARRRAKEAQRSGA